MATNKQTNAHNGAEASRPLRAVKKRRHRRPSLDAEIRAASRQIAATGMADAMKAGALIVCSRKLDETQKAIDEIRSILRSAGIGAVGTSSQAVLSQPSVSPPQVNAGPACVHCGRPAVRKTKPNAFNPTGSWFCQIHASLATGQEQEDALDNHLMGPAKGVAVKKKPVVVQSHPVEMRPQEEESQAEAEIQPPEAAPGASLEDAMSALGMGDGA